MRRSPRITQARPGHCSRGKEKNEAMIRILTDDLPSYKFPYTISNGSAESAFGYTLVQSYDKKKDDWIPCWCLIDSDGTPLAIIEADYFDEISPETLAQKASEFVMEMHGLGEEDTGKPVEVSKKHADDESYQFEIK